MELILELLYVRRRIRIEWKQMICAVILALLCVGLYGYANTHLEDAKEKMEERQTASAKHTFVPNPFIEMPLLPETYIKGYTDRVEPNLAAEEIDIPASVGNYSELEDTSETEDKKKVENKVTATKQVSERVPDVFMPDVITGMPEISIKNPGIVVEIPEDIAEDSDGWIDKNEAEDRPAEEDAEDTEDGENTEDTEDVEDTDKVEPERPIVLERFPGFLSNEKGHITGYTDASKFMKDHLVVFPVNGACTGIEKNALKGLEQEIHDIFIPANICYIAEGAFDDLWNLCYIEAAVGNREFYSKNGVLYYKNGEVAAYPNRLMKSYKR